MSHRVMSRYEVWEDDGTLYDPLTYHVKDPAILPPGHVWVDVYVGPDETGDEPRKEAA